MKSVLKNSKLLLLCHFSFFAQGSFGTKCEDKKGSIAKNGRTDKSARCLSSRRPGQQIICGLYHSCGGPNNRIHKWNAITNEVTFSRGMPARPMIIFMLTENGPAAADEEEFNFADR